MPAPTPTPTSTPAPKSPRPGPGLLTARQQAAGRVDLAVLGLGAALALAASNPPRWAADPPISWMLPIVLLLAAVWAAPAVVQRPTVGTHDALSRFARHRNTAFAGACTLAAGFGDPRVWLMVVDTGLLLAYLLAVDALAAGPVGRRQLVRARAPLAAAGASTLALLGALLPVDTGALWGRVVAAVAVAAAALAAGTALFLRQTSERKSDTS